MTLGLMALATAVQKPAQPLSDIAISSSTSITQSSAPVAEPSNSVIADSPQPTPAEPSKNAAHVILGSQSLSTSDRQFVEFLRQENQVAFVGYSATTAVIYRDSFIPEYLRFGNSDDYRNIRLALSDARRDVQPNYVYVFADYRSTEDYFLMQDMRPRIHVDVQNGAANQTTNTTSYASVLYQVTGAEENRIVYSWLEAMNTSTVLSPHNSLFTLGYTSVQEYKNSYVDHVFYNNFVPQLTDYDRSVLVALHEDGHRHDYLGNTSTAAQNKSDDVSEQRAETYAVARFLQISYQNHGADSQEWRRDLQKAREYLAEATWNDFLNLSVLQPSERSYDSAAILSRLLENDAKLLRDFLSPESNSGPITPKTLFQKFVVPAVQQYREDFSQQEAVAKDLANIKKTTDEKVSAQVKQSPKALYADVLTTNSGEDLVSPVLKQPQRAYPVTVVGFFDWRLYYVEALRDAGNQFAEGSPTRNRIDMLTTAAYEYKGVPRQPLEALRADLTRDEQRVFDRNKAEAGIALIFPLKVDDNPVRLQLSARYIVHEKSR
ncbi:MAG: hypothetical protein EYC62_02250 [Alphaproteobacteria bacterium]|nr:MAG: hypothetical protein EYC62_02250 [Alphaproteobacteria bacterium]